MSERRMSESIEILSIVGNIRESVKDYSSYQLENMRLVK